MSVIAVCPALLLIVLRCYCCCCCLLVHSIRVDIGETGVSDHVPHHHQMIAVMMRAVRHSAVTVVVRAAASPVAVALPVKRIGDDADTLRSINKISNERKKLQSKQLSLL